MSKTYGEMLDKLVDEMAKYDERADIFRRNDIPKGHFYNVINPDRKTSSGNMFHTPIEWMVKLTRDSGNFCMIKKVAADCRCIVITPGDIKELEKTDPAEALEVFRKILGMTALYGNNKKE